MYPFEAGTEGWRTSARSNFQGVRALHREASRAYLGQGCLRVELELVPGHSIYAYGEMELNLRDHPPKGFSRADFHNLCEAFVTFAIWVPEEAGGDPTAPHTLQLLVTDLEGRTKCSRPLSLANFPKRAWYQVAFDLAREPWETDEGADLARVVALGLRLGAGQGARARGYSGPIWIDAFTWALLSWPFRGISYTAWSPGDYQTPASEASLHQLLSTGANFIALLVTGYMDRPTSNSVSIDPARTPTDSSLIQAITTAHRLGLGVLLKPHVDCKDGTWRGLLAPQDPARWFATYKEFVLHYARLAQAHGVEMFAVGTEFRSLSSRYRPQWEEVIRAVREVYRGPITYAANWDEYPQVTFWDLVDYAGIDAYFPLTAKASPTEDELVQAWRPWLNKVEAWQGEVGKPVLFTEIGYRSVEYAPREPWDWSKGGAYDPHVQAYAYQATLRALGNRPWLLGVFWWNWLPNPRAGGTGNTDYTPQGKPAQQVLTKAFTARTLVVSDFEDGTTQGWLPTRGKAGAVGVPYVTQAQPYQGNHCLAFTISGGATINGGGALARNLNFQHFGELRLFVQVSDGASSGAVRGALVVKYGPQGTAVAGPWVDLRPGVWQSLALSLHEVGPLDFVTEVGFVLEGTGFGSITVFVDCLELAQKMPTVRDTIPPGPPTKVSVTSLQRGILLTWASPTDPDFSHVRVSRHCLDGEMVFDRVLTNFVLDLNLSPGASCYYNLRSVDLAGNESSLSGPYLAFFAPRENKALGKTVVASSNEAFSQWYRGEPHHVCDGDLGTRWSSAYTDGEWIQIDLGSAREVETVVIFWEAAFARAYEVRISLEGDLWETVFATTSGDGEVDIVALPRTPARYVRIQGLRRATPYGYSIWELEVY